MTTTVVIHPAGHMIEVVETETDTGASTVRVIPKDNPPHTLYVWQGHSLTIKEVPTENKS